MDQANDHKRKERNLRYQMRKKGYQINREVKVAVMPADDGRRSRLQEMRLQDMGYSIQYNMFNL